MASRVYAREYPAFDWLNRVLGAAILSLTPNLAVPHLWEDALRTALSSDFAREWLEQLHDDDEVLTTIRRAEFLFALDPGQSPELLEQLDALAHPYAQAQAAFWRGEDNDDEAYHLHLVNRYLGTAEEPLSSHLVLLRRPMCGVLDSEFCMKLDYALGLALFRLGRSAEGRNLLESAYDWAALLGSDLSWLASNHLSLQQALEGDYDNAQVQFESLAQTAGAQVSARAALHGVWTAFFGRNALADPPHAAQDFLVSRIVGETFKAFLSNQFRLPKRLVHLPTAQTLYALDRGRALGFALRHLDFVAIRAACDAVYALPPIRRGEDLFGYSIALTAHILALCHDHRTSEALALLRADQADPRMSETELGQMLLCINFTLCQFSLGGRELVPEVLTFLPTIERYLQKQPGFVRKRVIEFGARAYTNVFALFAHAGLDVPELHTYLEEECLVVSEDDAVYRGRVVPGYPRILGLTYTELFEPGAFDNPPLKRTLLKRLQRHREAIDALHLSEYPPIVYQPCIFTTLTQLGLPGPYAQR